VNTFDNVVSTVSAAHDAIRASRGEGQLQLSPLTLFRKENLRKRLCVKKRINHKKGDFMEDLSYIHANRLSTSVNLKIYYSLFFTIIHSKILSYFLLEKNLHIKSPHITLSKVTSETRKFDKNTIKILANYIQIETFCIIN